MAAFQADALVKTALCYEKLGQTDKAGEIYKRFDAADQKLKTITESVARDAGVNLGMPMEMQPAEKSEEVPRGS